MDDPELQPEQWVSARERLALLVNDGPLLIETFLDEESVKRIKNGNPALFLADGKEGPFINATVSSIDADATRVLPDGMLVAHNGGHILARNKDGKSIPEYSVYRVMLTVNNSPSEMRSNIWRGSLVIDASTESLISRYFRNLLAVIIRESGM